MGEQRKGGEKLFGRLATKLQTDINIMNNKDKEMKETLHKIRWIVHSEETEQYRLLLTSPRSQEVYRKGGSYSIQPPEGTPDMVPIDAVCTQKCGRHLKEDDILCLTTIKGQDNIHETIEIYAKACNEGGMNHIRIQELPDDKQDAITKAFIKAINETMANHISHMLNSDDVDITNPTGLATPDYIKELSPEQNNIIQRVGSNIFTVLSGIPGAGKTSTIAATVWALLECGNVRTVLIIAPTNEACQTLVKAMKTRGVKGVRWYATNAYAEGLPEEYSMTTHNMVNNLSEYPEMKGKGKKKMEQDILKSGRVVVCTPAMAQTKVILDHIHPDLIVFDEAGTASGVNLYKGLLRHKIGKESEEEPEKKKKKSDPNTKFQARYLIAGDEMQLKPYKYQELHTQSPFQDIITHQEDKIARLTCQWRMHPILAKIARNTYPYLKDGVTAGDRPLPTELEEHLRRHVGVTHAEDTTKKKGTSWESSSEAKIVVALAKALTKTPPKGYAPEKVLVLNPYEAQLQLINALLREQQVTGIRTSTIEKSQGTESEVTIISPVKLNASFATDKHRTNVALTRARTQLFVAADTEKIKNADSYGELWEKNLLGEVFQL